MNSNIKINEYIILKENDCTYKYESCIEKYSDILINFKIKNYRLIDLLYKINEQFSKKVILLPINKGKLIKENCIINSLQTPLIILCISPLIASQKNSNVYRRLVRDLINIRNGRALDIDEEEQENETFEETNNNLSNNFVNFTNQIMDMFSNSTNAINDLNTQHRETYREQIQQMKSMGFYDEDKIIQSLVVSEGCIDNAINYYLSN